MFGEANGPVDYAIIAVTSLITLATAVHTGMLLKSANKSRISAAWFALFALVTLSMLITIISATTNLGTQSGLEIIFFLTTTVTVQMFTIVELELTKTFPQPVRWVSITALTVAQVLTTIMALTYLGTGLAWFIDRKTLYNYSLDLTFIIINQAWLLSVDILTIAICLALLRFIIILRNIPLYTKLKFGGWTAAAAFFFIIGFISDYSPFIDGYWLWFVGGFANFGSIACALMVIETAVEAQGVSELRDPLNSRFLATSFKTDAAQPADGTAAAVE
eukprot:jgi/Hompol1/4780/HPOL_003912-RA